MDTFRGNFGSSDNGDDQRDYDLGDEDAGIDAPPAAIGTDERRMQVRAYNHWASQLQDRNFPSIEELEPDEIGDFGPYSVLLDFTGGIENPAVQYLGAELAEECGADAEIRHLDDVPARSLLSRITDHYMQILANQAPIGFEAEFINQRGSTILYRGILLPYSSDNETIDFIYGVINWKEMADQITSDELLLEIDQALEEEAATETPSETVPLADWADGPGISDLAGEGGDGENADDAFPAPAFGTEGQGEGPGDDGPFASLLHASPEPKSSSIDFDNKAGDAFADMEEESAGEAPEGLYDCLASARELAQAARSCEDRSRAALYAAVGRAYDFSIEARQAPEEFDELVSENGLTVQERAPMTPVVKLVFGADYDKTRLTEYAAVLNHAHRVGIERGALAGFLSAADGGLKGVVNAERRLRREESGKPVEPVDAPRAKLAKKLRAIAPQSFEAIEADGSEFGLVMIRRLETGEVAMLGEVPEDIPLIERAARKLIA